MYYDRTEGICVDIHVHRIANRFQWVNTWSKKNAKSQHTEKTRKVWEILYKVNDMALRNWKTGCQNRTGRPSIHCWLDLDKPFALRNDRNVRSVNCNETVLLAATKS